jgi:NADH-quinone oxidoreductase subunit C
MQIQDFKNLLVNQFGESTVLSIDENATPKALMVDGNQIVEICRFLHESDQTYFDLLSCLTGLDNGPEKDTMEVIYNLYSIPLEHSLMLKVLLKRANPSIESVSSIWQTANWHEREAFDLFGIQFANHPDLRRILMPADWVGHPMRLDYVEPEEYRGMKTIREEGLES